MNSEQQYRLYMKNRGIDIAPSKDTGNRRIRTHRGISDVWVVQREWIDRAGRQHWAAVNRFNSLQAAEACLAAVRTVRDGLGGAA